MNRNEKNLIIVGVGGHALSAWDLALQIGIRVIAFMKPPKFSGEGAKQISNSDLPVLEFDECRDYLSSQMFIGVGDNYFRMEIAKKLQNLGVKNFPNLISPSAIISRSASIGQGIFVGNNVSVGPDSSVGNFSILNTKVSVDHENHLSDFVSLAPGATTGGNVSVGFMSFVGMNSTIRQNVLIGQNCLVGALSFVKETMPENSISWGAPARIQGFRDFGDSFPI